MLVGAMSEPVLQDGPPVRPAEMIGRTVAGKFVVEGVVGAGAMGVVYRARQTSLDKVVAIKVMHAMLVSDPSFAARFHREARAASRLDHPNSIRILDFGEEPDGRLYIAMDYLDGRDLLEVINEEWPLATGRMVDILAQALSALAVAHDLGILHRDLKPENIMVLRGTSDEGLPLDVVKVCDFGIAKMIENRADDESEPSGEKAKLSTGGTVVGTPAYMSPEQARGDELDARSDVYAMGIILYQMLTTRVPFEGPTPLSTLLRLVNEEAVPPSAQSANVDPDLERVCLKAISKKPEDRYPTAREMRAALRKLAGGDGFPLSSGAIPLAGAKGAKNARSNTPTIPAPRKMPRFGPMGWLSVVLAIAALVGSIIGLRWRPSTSPAAVARADDQAAREGEPLDLDLATAPAAAARDPELDEAASPLAPQPSAAAANVEPPIGARPRAAGVRAAEASRSSDGAKAATSAGAATPAPRVTDAPPLAAPPAPRPIDPALAHAEIGTATHLIGTTGANVGKAMAGVGPKIDACYRAATGSGAPEGPGALHVETNEDGVVTEARLEPRFGAALASCIGSAVRGRKIANVDTGRASADVPLVFRLR